MEQKRTIIECRQVDKTFVTPKGDVPVVRDFHMQAGENELVALFGPGQCGKTTIINMIAGLEHVTKGEVYVNGTLVDKPGPERWLCCRTQNNNAPQIVRQEICRLVEQVCMANGQGLYFVKHQDRICQCCHAAHILPPAAKQGLQHLYHSCTYHRRFLPAFQLAENFGVLCIQHRIRMVLQQIFTAA